MWKFYVSLWHLQGHQSVYFTPKRKKPRFIFTWEYPMALEYVPSFADCTKKFISVDNIEVKVNSDLLW